MRRQAGASSAKFGGILAPSSNANLRPYKSCNVDHLQASRNCATYCFKTEIQLRLRRMFRSPIRRKPLFFIVMGAIDLKVSDPGALAQVLHVPSQSTGVAS